MTLAQDIARRMLERRAATASAKAPPKPSPETPKRPEPAQAPRKPVEPGREPVAAKPAELRSAPYVPPVRSEPDLAAVYRELPEVFGPHETLPPLPVLSPGFTGSCKAINPATGRQCALLKGHTKPHRHGNTEFLYAAAPEQKSFHRRVLLDAAATRNNHEAS